MKNRLPISRAKEGLYTFLESQAEIEIAMQGIDGYPMLEKAHYKYSQGIHVLMLVRTSSLLNKVKDGDCLSGMVFENEGGGLKSAKRFYGKYKCHSLALEDERLVAIGNEDAMYKKMIHHGARFFTLELVEGMVQLGPDAVYTVDSNYDVAFSPFQLNGIKRYENSRKIVMEYEDRTVIFNVIVEGNRYFTLTRADSNKVAYIQKGGRCKFFDGIENHFESKVEILPNEKVAEIFTKLQETNNAYFQSTEQLLALSFTKQEA